MSPKTKQLRVQPVCRSLFIEWEVQNCVFDQRLPLSPLLITHKDRFLYKWSHNSLLFQSHSRSVLLVTGPALKGCVVGAGYTRDPYSKQTEPTPMDNPSSLGSYLEIYAYTKNGELPISPLFLFSHCWLCECWNASRASRYFVPMMLDMDVTMTLTRTKGGVCWAQLSLWSRSGTFDSGIRE